MDKELYSELESRILATQEVLRTDVPTALIPESMRIYSLDEYMYQPSRFNGSFEAGDESSFADYVVNQIYVAKIIGLKCFIDPNSIKIETIFDLGNHTTPGHKSHRASFKPIKTPEYTAFLSVLENRMDQQSLVDFLHDWQPYIETDDGKENYSLAKAIQAIREITISAESTSDHSVQDMSRSRSTADKIEAASKHQLPERLYFNCQPYPEFETRRFELRLAVLPTDSSVELKLHPIGLDNHQESIRQEFIQRMKALFTDIDQDNRPTMLVGNMR